MCNLYSMTKNVDAIRRLFNALNSRAGNLPSMPGIFPDYPAPIIRNAPDGREIVMARWGMPSSQQALLDTTKKRAERLEGKGKPVDFKELLRMEPDSGTTNIRNVGSAHWKRWLGTESIVAWSPSRRSASTTRSMARRSRYGSFRTKAALCCRSPASGRTGPTSGRPRREKSRSMSTPS